METIVAAIITAVAGLLAPAIARLFLRDHRADLLKDLEILKGIAIEKRGQFQTYVDDQIDNFVNRGLARRDYAVAFKSYLVFWALLGVAFLLSIVDEKQVFDQDWLYVAAWAMLYLALFSLLHAAWFVVKALNKDEDSSVSEAKDFYEKLCPLPKSRSKRRFIFLLEGLHYPRDRDKDAAIREYNQAVIAGMVGIKESEYTRTLEGFHHRDLDTESIEKAFKMVANWDIFRRDLRIEKP